MEYRYETRVFEVKETTKENATPELYSELAFVRFFGFQEGLDIMVGDFTSYSCLPKAIISKGVKEGNAIHLTFIADGKVKKFDAIAREVHKVKYI